MNRYPARTINAGDAFFILSILIYEADLVDILYGDEIQLIELFFWDNEWILL